MGEQGTAPGDGTPRFFGACGVPDCNDCLPLFDLDNNEIPESAT